MGIAPPARSITAGMARPQIAAKAGERKNKRMRIFQDTQAGLRYT